MGKINQTIRNALLASPFSGVAFRWLYTLTNVHDPVQTKRITNKLVNHDKERVLLACMPKSGSTFITHVLKHALKSYPHRITFACDRAEQEIYWPSLIETINKDALFSHQHVRYTSTTKAAIKAYGMSVIVQVRNLFDIVPSLDDHLHKEGVELPMAYVDKNYFKMEQSKRFDMLIDLAIPWYFNFYTSWKLADKELSQDILWIRYEDMVADNEAVISQILNHIGQEDITQDTAKFINQAQKQNVRLNKGITGRGKQLLNEDQKARIVTMAKHYPHMDFTPIGIPSTPDSDSL